MTFRARDRWVTQEWWDETLTRRLTLALLLSPIMALLLPGIVAVGIFGKERH